MQQSWRVLFIAVVVLVVVLTLGGLYTRKSPTRCEPLRVQSQQNPLPLAPPTTTTPNISTVDHVLGVHEADKGKIGRFLSTLHPSKTQPFSKDLIVHAVYYDDRARCGHQNASVFLVAVKKTILKQSLIVGCVVGDHATAYFDAHLIGESYLMHMFFSHFTHEEILVNCFDLPVNDGSKAFIVYRKSKDAENITMAESEFPLMIPLPRQAPSKAHNYKFTILTCTKVFGRPPWLTEWLHYQKALGVDHVHLAAEDSFVRLGGMQNQYVKQLISEGYLSVAVWQNHLNYSEIWYHSQGLLLEDCIYRFRSTYDYVSILDTDDFFTPRIPGVTSLHYYVNRWCSHALIGSCALRWINHYPDCGLKGQVGEDGNVTSKLLSDKHVQEFHPKSIHRLSDILDVATHYPGQLMIGYRTVEIPQEAAYVAHVRKNQQPKNGGCQMDKKNPQDTLS